MASPPHLAHAAVPEQLDQLVAAELLRFLQPPAKAIEDPGRQHGDDRARVVGHHEDHGMGQRDHRVAEQICDEEGERIHRGRHERGDEDSLRRGRRDHGEDEDADRDPRQMNRVVWRGRNDPGVQNRDEDRC